MRGGLTTGRRGARPEDLRSSRRPRSQFDAGSPGGGRASCTRRAGSIPAPATFLAALLLGCVPFADGDQTCGVMVEPCQVVYAQAGSAWCDPNIDEKIQRCLDDGLPVTF